jgi:hypothetical protein
MRLDRILTLPTSHLALTQPVSLFGQTRTNNSIPFTYLHASDHYGLYTELTPTSEPIRAQYDWKRLDQQWRYPIRISRLYVQFRLIFVLALLGVGVRFVRSRL